MADRLAEFVLAVICLAVALASARQIIRARRSGHLRGRGYLVDRAKHPRQFNGMILVIGAMGCGFAVAAMIFLYRSL